MVGALTHPVALDNVEVLDQIRMLGRSRSSGTSTPHTRNPTHRRAPTPTGSPKSPYSGLDVLINNGGIETRTSLLETTEAGFDKVVAVNMKSAFLALHGSW